MVRRSRGRVGGTKRRRRRRAWPTVLVGGLVVLGGALIAQGVFRPFESVDDRDVVVGQPPVGPPEFAVRPGAGVYTGRVPSDTQEVRSGASCRGCDVVMVTVCSLRKDHLGAFGHPGELSPSFDRIADGAFRFERAYAASNFTLASLTAILTGRFGSSTGVTGWSKGLTKQIPTLPEVLGVYGYRTGAFTTDAPSGFRPDYGLDRGFSHMEITPPPQDTPDGRFNKGAAQGQDAVAKPFVNWVASQDSTTPIFAMLHTRTAHFPFVIEPPEAGTDPTGMTQLLWDAGQLDAQARVEDVAMPGMAGGTAQEGIVEIVSEDPLQRQVNRLGDPAVAVWRDHYAQGVRRMDDDLAAVWAALQTRGRLDQTIVVVVADHGESLNDHGELLHGDAFFDTVINVPLLIRVPKMKSGSSAIGALVSQVDIMPTILELVGAVIPAGTDGVSLVGLMAGKVDAVRGTALSEGGVARQEGPDLPGAVIIPPWVLLRQRRGCVGDAMRSPGLRRGLFPICLFNMDTDPEQLQDVAVDNIEVVESMLARWTSFTEARAAAGQALDLSPEFVEELRKSGYDFRLGPP